MSKLIKGWEDLVGLESAGYRLDIDLDWGCGTIVPKVETEETKKNFWEHYRYLGTRTFSKRKYKEATRVLQKFGFDVVLVGQDEEDKDGCKG